MNGTPGDAVQILGILESTSGLPSASTVPRNTAYIITDNDTGSYIYFIVGTEGDLDWAHVPFENATTVLVNGEHVEIFDADTKVSKVSGSYKLYGRDANGNEVGIPWAYNPQTNKIPCWAYVDASHPAVLSASDPVSAVNVATKGYVDDTKVAKYTGSTGIQKVYGITTSGAETTYDIATSPYLLTQGRLARYFDPSEAIADSDPNTKGKLVQSDPTKPYHVANKHYVDTTTVPRKTTATTYSTLYGINADGTEDRNVSYSSNALDPNIIVARRPSSTGETGSIRVPLATKLEDSATSKQYVDNHTYSQFATSASPVSATQPKWNYEYQITALSANTVITIKGAQGGTYTGKLIIFSGQSQGIYVDGNIYNQTVSTYEISGGNASIRLTKII